MALEKTFQCTVISPVGMLLNGSCTFVVFPAHDGEVGIYPNHMPMFCELGMGLLDVRFIEPNHTQPTTKYMLLDGGFAVVCENQLKIVSYDVVFPERTSAEQFDNIRRRIQKDIDSESLDQVHRRHLQHKLELLERIMPTSATTD